MISINSLMKSYKSSKDFYSLNILESLINISSNTTYPPNHEIWYNLLKKERIPKINTRFNKFKFIIKDINILTKLN